MKHAMNRGFCVFANSTMTSTVPSSKHMDGRISDPIRQILIPEFEEEEEEQENGRQPRKKYRYRWPDEIRDEY